MSFIWATRGRTWGFTFLSTAGQRDPLPEYERAMVGLDGARRGCVSTGDAVALKFEDPERRRDRAGRVIPHGFVLYGELAERVATVEDGLREVWPLVSARYESVWDAEQAPPAFGRIDR